MVKVLPGAGARLEHGRARAAVAQQVEAVVGHGSTSTSAASSGAHTSRASAPNRVVSPGKLSSGCGTAAVSRVNGASAPKTRTCSGSSRSGA